MTQCNKYSIAESKDLLGSIDKEFSGSEKVTMRSRQLSWVLLVIKERGSAGEMHSRIRQGSGMAEPHTWQVWRASTCSVMEEVWEEWQVGSDPTARTSAGLATT